MLPKILMRRQLWRLNVRHLLQQQIHGQMPQNWRKRLTTLITC